MSSVSSPVLVVLSHFSCSHPSGCEVLPHCGGSAFHEWLMILSIFSLKEMKIKNSFAIYVSFGQISVQNFSQIFNGVFKLWNCKISFCSLDISFL